MGDGLAGTGNDRGGGMMLGLYEGLEGEKKKILAQAGSGEHPPRIVLTVASASLPQPCRKQPHVACLSIESLKQ